MDLSVVMINWGMAEELIGCLDALNLASSTLDVELLVVDKPSRDHLEERLESLAIPNLKYRRVDTFGVGSMRNCGIRESCGRFVLMLDSDTRLTAKNLDDMVCFMERHPACGASGAKLLSFDGSLQYSCRTFYSLPVILFRRTPLGKMFPNSAILRRHLMRDWDHATVREVDWIQGAFFMMRREAIDEVGLFADATQFGFEDVDWCFRAWQKNWRILYNPEVNVIHKYQRSSARSVLRAYCHFVAALRFFLRTSFTADRSSSRYWPELKHRDNGVV